MLSLLKLQWQEIIVHASEACTIIYHCLTPRVKRTNFVFQSWSLVGIVLMIAAGLIMFTYKATQFNLLGFNFLLIASFAAGLRWTFAQLLMQKSKLGLHNPIDMVFHVQPWMFLSLLPFTIMFEGEFIYFYYYSTYIRHVTFSIWPQHCKALVINAWRQISKFYFKRNIFTNIYLDLP